MEPYTLGLFANMYPAFDGDLNGIFIWRMVKKLEDRGIIVKKAVKQSPGVLGYFPFYVTSAFLCRNNTLDILQAHYIPHSSIIPSILKHNKPLVIKFHGDDARIFPYKNSLNRRIVYASLRRADHVLTASEEMRKGLIALGGDQNKITALSSGVDTREYAPGDRDQSRKTLGLPTDGTMIILFVGRIHPWKGIREMIEAARNLHHMLFIFIGPGTIPDHPENCRFIGNIPHENVKTWITAADISLLPSYTEGISNFLMESLSCEVPAIASDVGGNPELVKDHETGLLVPAKNSQALSEVISWMSVHESDRKLMGKRGRADMVSRYHDDLLISKLIEIHTTLLE
jgi:glycosyltransferase involved in cell wall biosynthesis